MSIRLGFLGLLKTLLLLYFGCIWGSHFLGQVVKQSFWKKTQQILTDNWKAPFLSFLGFTCYFPFSWSLRVGWGGQRATSLGPETSLFLLLFFFGGGGVLLFCFFLEDKTRKNYVPPKKGHFCFFQCLPLFLPIFLHSPLSHTHSLSSPLLSSPFSLSLSLSISLFFFFIFFAFLSLFFFFIISSSLFVFLPCLFAFSFLKRTSSTCFNLKLFEHSFFWFLSWFVFQV